MRAAAAGAASSGFACVLSQKGRMHVCCSISNIVAGLQVAQMSQEVRDAVGTLLLQLTLKELFQWRFMQTDPNWGNFLFDGDTGILHLIDFGKLLSLLSSIRSMVSIT